MPIAVECILLSRTINIEEMLGGLKYILEPI